MSAVIHDPSSAGGDARRSPLVAGPAASPVAFCGGRDIAREAFAAQVRGVARLLPAAGAVVNLCEDRYRFLVAFCAAASRGLVTLLPPSRTREAIDEVRRRHPGSLCVGDGEGCGCTADLVDPQAHYLRLPDALPETDGAPPTAVDDAVVAIGFTSGSTGAPTPNAKTWAAFRAGTAQNLAALAGLWAPDAVPRIVATVPPQHMYGIELSVLFPLLAGAAVHGGRPLFPEDVAAALGEADGPRLLVTTPVHLRALLAADIDLPVLAGIVTATAPLPPEVARAAEARFGCEVRELFGSTETCVIARRRTARETLWTLHPGVRLQPQPDGTLVDAPHLPAPVALADLVELHPGGRFRLCGRQADMVEIAGKRASLGDLTHRLLAVPGVRDGVVFQLGDPGDSGVRRIAALVVADGLAEADLLAALRTGVDPVFLPRRIRFLDALPRNDCGKLPREVLLRVLAQGPAGMAAAPAG